MTKQHVLQDYFASHGERLSQSQRVALEDFALWMDDAKQVEPTRDAVVPFVVKHYASDERPMIKGNGFDGLEIGGNREEAEEFVTWLNERLAPNRGAES